MIFCRDCDAKLTAEEAHYYEYRCERCERLWSERIDAYRLGKRDDQELEEMFGVPKMN